MLQKRATDDQYICSGPYSTDIVWMDKLGTGNSKVAVSIGKTADSSQGA